MRTYVRHVAEGQTEKAPERRRVNPPPFYGTDRRQQPYQPQASDDPEADAEHDRRNTPRADR